MNYKCPECGLEEQEESVRGSRPRLKLCWFCHLIKGKNILMEEINNTPGIDKPERKIYNVTK